jgi:hypothetical protein
VTNVDVVAEAICRAAHPTLADEMISEMVRNDTAYHYRRMARAAIDAIMSKVTRVDVIEPRGQSGRREHCADS